MNISHWTVSEVMQLPDHLFGRRYCVCCTGHPIEAGRSWDIAELAFPERMVLWEVHVGWTHAYDASGIFKMFLNDIVPTTTGEAYGREPLIANFGREGGLPPSIPYSLNRGMHLVNIRLPIEPGGRRLVLEVRGTLQKDVEVMAILVISGFPTEIPDWFLKV